MTEPLSDAARSTAGKPMDSTAYPTNHVLAIVDTPAQFIAAEAALRDAGFLGSEVEFSCGTAAADILAASTGRTGLGNVATRIAEWLGVTNDEMAVKDRYGQALRDGQIVALVLAPGDGRKELAARVVREHGGHFVNYLGRFSIEALHP